MAQKKIRRQNPLVMTEMIAVIFIIGILAALVFDVVFDAREEANLTACRNNLRQMHVAITVYGNENDGDLPPWLSAMEASLPPGGVLVCPFDASGGAEGAAPDILRDDDAQYAEANDTTTLTARDRAALGDYRRRTLALRGEGVRTCSYLYEWTGERCSWYDGDYDDGPDPDLDLDGDGKTEAWSWRIVKEYEARSTLVAPASRRKPDADGGRWEPDPEASTVATGPRVPLVRCFHGQPVDDSGAFDESEYRVQALLREGDTKLLPPRFWWMHAGDGR